MKNVKTLLILLLLSTASIAQNECTQIWKNTFPVEPKWRMINADATLILEGTLNEVAMIDAISGSILWQLNFKKSLGIKSANGWDWDKDRGVVKVRVKGEKKEEEKTTYYEEKTGVAISDISAVVLNQKKVKNKKRYNSYLYLKDKGLTLSLTYQKRTMGELIKRKPLSITIECNGNKTWSKTIEAKVTTSLCENRAEGGEPLIDFNVQGDKVFLIYDGVSVIDLNSGNVLWQTIFDNAEYDFGLFKSTQTLGRAGSPLSTDDGVYVVDLSKDQHCIKKFEIETGKLVWKSEAFDKDAIVPELSIINNVLVAHFGGRVTVETYIPAQSGSGDTYKTEPKMKGDFSLKGYDITNGKLLWETNKMKELSDKFSNALTNMVTIDNAVYVASDKNFYAFTSNGKTKYNTPINKVGLGNPVKMFSHQNNIIIMFEEGVGSFDMSSGKQNYTTDTKKALGEFMEGNVFYVWTGSDVFSLEDFVRFDLNNGQIISKMKDTPYPFFSEDGEEFIKFKGEQYFRYKTK